MTLRTKMRRRLLVVLAGVVVLGGILAGAVALRAHRLRAALFRDREVGIEAIKAEQYATGLHKVGRYLQRYGDDDDALLHYAIARRHVAEPDNKHYREAISVLRDLVTRNPNNREARQHLLDLYVVVGFDTEAIGEADGILATDPTNVAARRARAVVLGRKKRFDEAVAEAVTAADVAPTDLRSQLLVLQLLHEQGAGGERLIARSDELRNTHATDARFALVQAVARTIVGDREGAVRYAREAAGLTMPDAEAFSLLVRQLDELELFNEALAVLERAADAPGETDVAARRALVSRLWESKRSADIVTRLASLDPASPTSDTQLLAFRAMALHAVGEPDEAAVIESALATRKADAQARAWAAVLPVVFPRSNSAPDDSAAIDACAVALRTVASPHLHFLMAEALARNGSDESAIRHYGDAFLGARAWAEPLAQMARALIRKQRPVEAVQAAEAAAKRAPGDADVLATVCAARYAALAGGATQSPDEVLALAREVQRMRPGEEQTLPILVDLLAVGDKTAAADAARAALSSAAGTGERALLTLADTVRRRELGPALEQQCLDACRAHHGLTPDLAFELARRSADAGRPDEGRALLDAPAADRRGNEADWDLAVARYLDLTGDPDARDAWVAVGNERPLDLRVQWQVLAARAVQNDAAFLDMTIDRIKARSGDGGLGWRMAKAQLTLRGKPSDKQLAEAAILLNEVIRSAPDLLVPRLLLADCLERLGNAQEAIEQLLLAAARTPASEDIKLQLARLYLATGDAARARDSLKSVTDRDRLTLRQRRTAASLLARMGESAAAVELLREAPPVPESDRAPGSTAAGDGEAGAVDLFTANIYRRRGQIDRAAAAFKQLLESDPTIPTIHHAADFYASLGRPADAAAALAFLDRVDAPPGVKELLRGEYEARHGTPEAALAAFRAATTTAPQDALAWRRLLAFLADAGRVEDVVATLREATAAIPGDQALATLTRSESSVRLAVTDAVVRPLLAWALQHAADTEAVVGALRDLADARSASVPAAERAARLGAVADRHPKLLPLQLMAAKGLASGGQVDAAVRVARRAMETFPSAAEPAQFAAALHAEAGQWPEAAATAEAWKRRSPADALAADVVVAAAQLNQKNPTAAIRQLETYAAVGPDDADRYADAILLYARARMDAGQAGELAGTMESLLAASPKVRVGWAQLVARQHPDTAAAAAALDKIEAAAPRPSPTEQLARAQAWRSLWARTREEEHRRRGLIVLGDVAAALPDPRPGSTTAPVDPPVGSMVVVAGLYEEFGELPTAEKLYRRVLQVNPEVPVVQNNLAMVILASNGDLGEALDLATRAARAERDPHVAHYCETLARVHAIREEFDEAVASMGRAVALRPDNADWVVRLARIQFDGGRVRDARASLGRLTAPTRDRLSPEGRQQLEALQTELSRGDPAARS